MNLSRVCISSVYYKKIYQGPNNKPKGTGQKNDIQSILNPRHYEDNFGPENE